jgi:hypothetical protein
MVLPEPEILDLTAVDDEVRFFLQVDSHVDAHCVMQPVNSRNIFRVSVPANMTGTYQLEATPLYPGSFVRSVYSFFLYAHVLFRS